jgi:hypothetical protein
MGESAIAYDASLPYQNYPSFECFRRNARNECVDFTYDPNDTSSSSSRSRSTSSRSSSVSGNGDIEINIDPDGDAVRPGEFVEFVIELRNTRNSRVTTDVRAEFDSDLDFQSASRNGDDIGNDEVEWQNIRVDGRDTEELKLRVRVRTGARVGRTLRLRVSADGNEEEATVVTSTRSRSSDTCDSNDTCGLRTAGESRVRITSSPDPFEPGQQVRYAIRIDNEESFDRRIDVRATLDPDTTYVSSSNGGDHTSHIVRWDDLRIDGDETLTLLLNVYTDRDIRDGHEIHLEVEVNGVTEDEEDTEARF